jgi:hypothetical protein
MVKRREAEESVSAHMEVDWVERLLSTMTIDLKLSVWIRMGELHDDGVAVGVPHVGQSGTEVAIVIVTVIETDSEDGTGMIMTGAAGVSTIAMSAVTDPGPDRRVVTEDGNETGLTTDEESRPVPGAQTKGALIMTNAIAVGSVTIHRTGVGIIDTMAETEIQSTVVGGDVTTVLHAFYLMILMSIKHGHRRLG